VTGKLGLIQVGIEKKVYLIDVVAYPECMTTMKDILEDENIEKVMWDGRSDATELWCGHGIALRSVIDLQLIRVYVSQRGVRGPRGYMKLDGMARTFENSDRAVKLESGIDMRRFIQSLSFISWLIVVSDEVKTKHKNDETECWISRPLDDVLLEYAAFDIMQLRGIYSLYRTYLLRYPHIKVESQRYVDMFRDERRIKNCWYVDHGVLPQEILERPQQTKASYDHLGTHNCGGCGRDLHQESFGVLFGMWRKGQLCYTCAEARRFRSNPPPVRLIGRRY
jgi:hypothetical protein